MERPQTDRQTDSLSEGSTTTQPLQNQSGMTEPSGVTPQALPPRERLAAFTAVLKEIIAIQGPLECPTKHSFAPGLYSREILIPQGACVIGKVHLEESLWVVSMGHLRIFSVNGDVFDAYAGDTGTTVPGTQRAFYAFEDSKFIVTHPNPTNERNIEALEARFVVETIEEWETKCLTSH